MENKNFRNLKDFFQNINYDWDNCKIELGSGIQILKTEFEEFEITPSEFLNYAHLDFSLSDNHGYINALTNVKRAIECQCEIIHSSFGLSYRNLSFPKKIINLKKMGISPSMIFKNINNIRVGLEHFYKRPDPERVEDAIQVAELFLDVTNYSLTSFWDEYTLYQQNEENLYIEDKLIYGICNGIRIKYKYELYQFELTQIKNGKIIGGFTISKDDIDEYLKLISLTIKCGKNSARINAGDEDVQKFIIEDFFADVFC